MDLVNPCAYLRFVGAIANGGETMAPHIVSSIEVGIKTTYEARPDRGERIMSEETARILREMLRSTVRDYYGDESFPGLTVCAKSGTAEVGAGKKPNAMFTGFLEDAGMPLAFIVCIEDGGYGRQTCVPVLQPILNECKLLFAE
jgi:peptidoglycan glycosyltransferase